MRAWPGLAARAATPAAPPVLPKVAWCICTPEHCQKRPIMSSLVFLQCPEKIFLDFGLITMKLQP